MRKETTKLAEFYFTEIIDCFSVYYSPQCPSTGALAKEAVQQYTGVGSVLVYTFHQTEGKGQGNNKWESEPGKNLAFTLAMDITNKAEWLIGFNKAIALGVKHAIESITEMKTEIKWPNDILINNLKMSGLLMESWKIKDKTYLVCGIGVNVNQIQFSQEFVATSMSNETGEEFELLKVLKEIIKSICYHINLMNINGISEIDRNFNQVLWMKDQWIWLDSEDGTSLEVKLLAVDDYGRIVFEDKGQHIKHLHHGQVKIAKKNYPIF